MSFPRYGAYRESGVEWLGEVPRHWHVKPIKAVGEVVNGFPFDSALFDPKGGYPLVRIRDLDSVETETRFAGEFIEGAAVTNQDVLIGMDGDFSVGRWRGEGVALLNQRMCCIRTPDAHLTRFVEYALPTPLRLINETTYATTVKHLSSSQVRRIKIAMPPAHDELVAIVDYLDREIVKLDALVTEQQRLIALLTEKRQAVISHAVTKGVNLAAPTKASHVEWLGDVPAHWRVMPIRKAARLESGHTPSRSRPEYWESCTEPWFTLADVWQIREGGVEYVNETKEKVSQLGLANSAARLLPAGTVMLSRTASVGFSAIMAVPMATTQDFANWVCGPELRPEYLLYTFRAMAGEFDRLKMGSTHNTIYMPDIQSLRFALPSLDEQGEIVAYVRKHLLELEEFAQQAQHAVDLLQERRIALISAAVTGQIDVRGFGDARTSGVAAEAAAA